MKTLIANPSFESFKIGQAVAMSAKMIGVKGVTAGTKLNKLVEKLNAHYAVHQYLDQHDYRLLETMQRAQCFVGKVI